MPLKPAVADLSAPTIALNVLAKNLSDAVYTRLTVTRPVGVDKNRRVLWECRCECGSHIVIPSLSLTSGNTKSCGCFHADTVSTHRQSASATGFATRAYRIWNGLQQRCLNKNNPDYEKYGGRGITVCDRWIESFENFYADMGDCPSTKHSIDRRDNDGPYSPENCRWATKKEQDRNKRNNRRVEWNGETKCMVEWAEIIGVSAALLTYRVNKWGMERAVMTPYNGRILWPPVIQPPSGNVAIE